MQQQQQQQQQQIMQGLVVTIAPSQSAFFAGEQFTATITFMNPNRPSTISNNNPRRPSSSSTSTNPNYLNPNSSSQGNNNDKIIISQSANPRITSSDWSKLQEDSLLNKSNNNDGNSRRTSTSSSIAKYSTSYQDTQDFPTSPFYGTPNPNTPQPSQNQNQNQTTTINRDSIISTSTGGALPTPHSALFGPLPIISQNQNLHRSVSTNALAGPSTSNTSTTNPPSNSKSTTPALPTRKGLIGKPIRTSISALVNTEEGVVRRSSAGIYGNQSRRPTGGSHGRAQSMAVSSPELLQGSGRGGSSRSTSTTSPERDRGGRKNGTPPNSAAGLGGVRNHGKSRLGGSLGGEGLASLLLDQSRRGSESGVPPSILEEPSSPSFAATTNMNSNSTLSLSSPPRKSSPYIPHPPAPTSSSSSLSTRDHQTYSSSTSLNNSETSHPSDSSLILHDLKKQNLYSRYVSGSSGGGGGRGDENFYGLKNDTMNSLIRENLNDQTQRREGGSSTSTINQIYEDEYEEEAEAKAEEEEPEDDPEELQNNKQQPQKNDSEDPYPEYRPSHVPPPPPSSHRRNSTTSHPPNLNPFLHPPNTLTLLWSFAHLEGTFEVEEALIKPTEFNLLKASLLSPLVPGSVIGGGTLDDRISSASLGTSGGWRDWIWGGANSTGGGGGGGESPIVGEGRRKGVGVGGATLEERKKERMKEKSIPVFSCPPSILGVDLVLEPGESKSYVFSIRIPADLPPSFRGKSIKFSYHLVVGTNRAALSSTLRGATRDSLSRVMRVPIRVYNHVAVTGARPFYDLTNPIVYHRDEAIVKGVDDVKVKKVIKKLSASGRKEFDAYATTLLDSVIHHIPNIPGGYIPNDEDRMTPIIMESEPELRPEMRSRIGSITEGINLGEGNLPVEEEGTGCKAAVEIVSRNSQKVSYDINKDGFMVAGLTLVKSAYRLGETVNGSVVVNSGDGRVLRVSARLETHELIETSISTKPAPQIRQITRRLHSECHETTLDSARVGFALAIPSGGTPDFATSGVKLQWSVRLSFLVIPPSPDSPLPPIKKSRASPTTGGSIAPSSSSSASPSRHGRSKSFAYGFEPSVPLTLPAAPSILPTGATHLMPVLGPLDTSTSHTSYRAVPDLGFVPVLFTSNTPERPPPPGPLQRSASGTSHHKVSPSLSSMRAFNPIVIQQQQNSVVLVPAKIETVECSIPIKVYPGNTPFRPAVQIFAA